MFIDGTDDDDIYRIELSIAYICMQECDLFRARAKSIPVHIEVLFFCPKHSTVMSLIRGRVLVAKDYVSRARFQYPESDIKPSAVAKDQDARSMKGTSTFGKHVHIPLDSRQRMLGFQAGLDDEIP